MRKTIFLVSAVMCSIVTMFAQNNKVSYQAVVRNTATNWW